MSDRKRFVAAAPAGFGPSDFLNLWEVEELCRTARREGLPDESEVRVEMDKTWYRRRYMIVHDPSKRTVASMTHPLTPVEQAMESRGPRLLEIGFQRHSDIRKPITIRVQVSDDATNTVMTSLELTEHQWAALLTGSVIKVQDTL